ncbi:MAG: DoxX family protein [Candidatus Heimdallarchaeota archaeon]
MAMQAIREINAQQVSGTYVALIRLSLGAAFLTTWVSNIMKGVFTPTGYVGTISFFLDDPMHVVTPLDTIVRDFVFPNAALMAPGWMFLELFISVTVLFGVFTRPGALVGAFVSSVLLFTTLGVDWVWTYVLMIVGFVICAITGAGRWYGIDYWLRDKLPSGIVKFLV